MLYLTPPMPPNVVLRRGFTLVELMVTLAVLAVVLAAAVPSLQEFTANNRLVATKSSFASALALARTEAAKRSRTVVLQALGTGVSGNEFVNGWEVAVDEDGNGTIADTELRVRKNATSLDRITLSGAAELRFRATGALTGTSAEAFTLCRTGGTRGYTITVMPSGVTDVTSINTCTP